MEPEPKRTEGQTEIGVTPIDIDGGFIDDCVFKKKVRNERPPGVNSLDWVS